jgi:two-component system phosphate regulon sensor histidine kinase PhoR
VKIFPNILNQNDTFFDLFENGSNSVVIIDIQGNILYSNPGFQLMTEYSKEELLKIKFQKLLKIEFVKTFEKIISFDLKKEKSWKGELEHIKKNKISYWTTSYFNAIKNTQNEVVGFFILEDDISTIKQLTLQLEIKANILYEEKFKIESILNNIPFGLVVVEEDNSISYINEKFNQLFFNEFGRKMLVNSILNNYSPNYVVNEVLNLIKSRKNNETILNLPSNKHWQVNLFFLEKNNFKNLFMIVFRDISSFIEFELLQRQFITSISHELRTPIAAIQLSINNYLNFKDRLSEEQNENLLNIIKQNANILKNIVEDLLIISNIDNKKLQLRNWKEINVKIALNQLILQLNPISEVKNIHFTINCNPNIFIFGDDERFNQILRIPVENAIKYSHNNSEINISVLNNYFGSYNPENSSGILIIIEDFGLCIKNDELNYLFKRFYRGSNVQNIQGTGIGLSILKELIQLFRGDIFIESIENKGTLVNIFLPLIKSREEIL